MKKIIFSIFIFCIIILIYQNYFKSNLVKDPYNLSSENIKNIYCEISGGRIVHLNENDKKTMISEISKRKSFKANGVIGTVGYKFIIELNDGKKMSFIENAYYSIEMHSEDDRNFTQYLYTPKTATLIQKIKKENNFD